ncbi:MAG: hypothetical protein ABI442_13470 [Gemmatimonadaceae bacterium]
MFFRGRQPEASIWRRFRTSEDGFTFAQEGDVYTAHIVANAERVVDLFHSFTEQFPAAVDVVMDDLRSGRSWKGEGVALLEAREAIARLKILLARYGGVELSVYTGDDQLTLNPNLELFMYARSDRWLYLLEGRGLEEQQQIYSKSWKTNRGQFPAAPDLVNAVTAAADRLGLSPA